MCRGIQQDTPFHDRTLTAHGSVVGTPEYMAPEQASGKRNFDPRTDVYAVGIMLYEALSGTRAFHGRDPRAVLVSVIAKRLPSLRAVCPEISVSLDRIVARATSRDPRMRYANTGEFQHDLLEARTSIRRMRAAFDVSSLDVTVCDGGRSLQQGVRSSARPWSDPGHARSRG